jgi:uncharacterized membrane protein YuzA (DUF378 family)
MKLNTLDTVAVVLTIIGAINWGLIGLVNLNVVDAIFGTASVLSKIVYILVGLSGVYLAIIMTKLERRA